MDINTDIVNWLRDMGYHGEMPPSENFVSICNNSTKFIWEQLTQNIRPKQEVEKIRRNIILSRLKSKPLYRQDDFVYKVKEIEDFKTKIQNEEKYKVMNETVQAKQNKVDQLSQKCRIKDISIDLTKKKIQENEQRKYLLDAKKERLEAQNLQLKETLTELKSVTPVEREGSSTADEITETLEKCAEELSNILKNNQKLISQKIHKPAGSYSTVKKKNLHDQTSVATYLLVQEQEHFDEITRSCKKLSIDKENLDVNIQQDQHKKSKHRLFDPPQVIIEDTEKNSFASLGVQKLSLEGNSDISPITRKRESLGLLPDSFLEEMGSNDSFLNVIGTTSNSEIFSDNMKESVSSINSNNNSRDSVVFKIPENRGAVKKPEKTTESIKAQLYSNKAVNRQLEKLLQGNNRELIYEVLQKCMHTMDFIKVVSVENSTGARKRNVVDDDLAKLRFIHIQTELKILKQKKIFKNLIARIGRTKMHVLSSIKSKEDITKVQDWLETNMKRVALDSSLESMKKEIKISSEAAENYDNDLQVLSNRIAKYKNDIEIKMQLIEGVIKDLYETQKYIEATRDLVSSPIWHIRLYKTESDWMNPLTEDLLSEELRVFEDFPLEYQKRCIHTEPKTFYRDICVDNYPQHTEINQDDLQMLTEILESPFSPPETILLNILKAKVKMNVLKSLRNKKSNQSFVLENNKKYSLENLHRQESYLEFAVDRIKSLMFSPNATKTLSAGDVVKQSMDIWMDMPMKDFCNGRLFEGHNFQFYLKKLNAFS